MITGRRPSRALSFLVAIFVAFCGTASAQDNYPIGPGDVLEISFLSNPDFDRSVKVGMDGNVFLPLVRELNVRDQTINSVRDKVAILLTGSVFRERIDGEYLFISVEPDEVLLEVAQYRPVFFDGDVIAPGKQDFLVGMTARQGIAVAQGLSNGGFVAPRQPDVRSHPRVMMAELVGVLAEISVYEAILNGSEELDVTAIERLNAPRDLISNAVAFARNQVATSDDILTEELSFLDTSVQEAETRVIAALRHEEAMTDIVRAEETEVTRIEVLVARGVVSSEQLTQIRRIYLQAIDRLGNVQADRLAAEADRRELVLERNQAVRERALEMQSRLQELSQQASQLQVRIELSAAGPVTLETEETATDQAPRIVIFRQSGGQTQEIDGTLDTPLYPGDVVKVSVRN